MIATVRPPAMSWAMSCRRLYVGNHSTIGNQDRKTSLQVHLVGKKCLLKDFANDELSISELET